MSVKRESVIKLHNQNHIWTCSAVTDLHEKLKSACTQSNKTKLGSYYAAGVEIAGNNLYNVYSQISWRLEKRTDEAKRIHIFTRASPRGANGPSSQARLKVNST